MTRSSSPAPRARRARLISALALTSVAVIACTAQTAGASSRATQTGAAQADVQTSVPWGACPPLQKGATRDPREKCGTVKVPLNYQNPGRQDPSPSRSRGSPPPSPASGAVYSC